MTREIFWQDIVFPGDIVDLSNTGNEGLILPSGTTIQRPLVPINGTIRYNLSNNETELYQNGSWSAISTTLVSGESNTASNLGSGQGVFAQKSGVDLQFRSLIAGSNISLSSNATSITINATSVGEANTVTNIGTGIGLFDSKVGVVLNFKTLSTSTPSNIAITNAGNEVNVNFIGTLGEINTGQNIGSGSQIFESKVGTVLRYRSITASSPINVTQSANEINIGLDQNPVFIGNGAITVVSGTTAQRPGTPTNGMLRYNTSLSQLEGYINSSWSIITTATGTFLPLSGGTMTGNITMSGSNIILNSAGSITVNGGNIVINGATSNLDMSTGNNIIMAPGKTIDGRDVSIDGGLIDQINTSNGLVTRTASNTFTSRTITGTSNQISVSNGNGVSGNPVLSIANDPIIPGNASITIPLGTTAQRSGSPINGMLRANGDNNLLEFYINSSWRNILDDSGGVILGNIDLSNNNLLNVTAINGRNITNDGIILDDLQAISNNTGVVVKSSGDFITRLIQNSNMSSLLGINVSGGDGSSDISIGLGILGLSIKTSVDSTDYIPIYDLANNTNKRIQVQSLLDSIDTAGFDNLFLSLNGGIITGDITITGGNIIFNNNKTIVTGSVSNPIVSSNSSFTIDGVTINLTAGQNIDDIINAINTNSGIISLGTITSDSIGTPRRIRIIKTGTNLILANTSGTPLADLGIINGTYTSNTKVDGRDLSVDGMVLDNINANSEFGFISRTSDTPSFARRILTASSSDSLLGINVSNGNGVSGNPIIGLDIDGLTLNTLVSSADSLPTFNSTNSRNERTTFSNILTYMRSNINVSFFRATVNAISINNGINIIDFSSGSEQFDNNTDFDHTTGEYTPPSGYYRLNGYIEVTSSANTGLYYISLLKNGVVETTKDITGDGTNLLSGFVEALVSSNGTDIFTLEINNTTGSSSTISTISFFGNKVY